MPPQQDRTQREFQELMERVRQGDPEAVREFVEEYAEHVTRFVRRYWARELRSKFDLEDHVQEVWKSFFARLSELHFAHRQVLLAFLFRMAHNQVVGTNLHFMRTQKNDIHREISLEDSVLERKTLVSREAPPEKRVDCQDEIDWILKNSRPLAHEIAWRIAEGHSQRDAARQLHVTEKTVGRYMKIFRLRAERKQAEDTGAGEAQGPPISQISNRQPNSVRIQPDPDRR